MNLEPISELKPSDLENLTPEQEKILKTLRLQLIDYNRDRLEKLTWGHDERIVGLVGFYSQIQIRLKVEGD